MQDYFKKDTDTVIFDIGNVLIKFAWEDYLATFPFDRKTRDKIAGAMFCNEDWDRGDSGLITTEEWLELFIANAPDEETQIREVFSSFGQTIVPFPFTEDWIAYFRKKGFRIFYLSNYSEEMFRQSKDRLSFLEGFDGGIFSWKERCMKPQSEIYERLLKRYCITPERAVFFDDRRENIMAARELGIQGVVFTPDMPLQTMRK